MQLGRSVAETQATVSSAEFTYWCAVYRTDEFGWRKERSVASHVQATIANTVPRKRNSRAFKPADFLPKE